MTRLAPLLILFTAMAAQAAGPAPRERIERGRYLINATGCMDCHTPLKNGPRGPEPDRTRLFAGHPEALAMPPAPALPAGPWRVSYTANLTPDPDTGLGRWSAQDFVRTMRSGRHLGSGRPLLPPMPAAYGQMSDEDLQAMFAYLQTLPPVRNRVPAPLPPAAR